MILTCPLCSGIHYIKIIEKYPVEIEFFCHNTNRRFNYVYLKQFLHNKETANYCQNRYLITCIQYCLFNSVYINTYKSF